MRKTALAVLMTLSLAVQAQTPPQATPPQAAPARSGLPQPTPEQLKQMQAAMAMQMQMMAVLYDVRPARLGFEETLGAIRAGAAKRGWQVGETQDVQAVMRQGGIKDAKRMKVMQLCPAGASEKVAKAGAGKVPALPCRATVFEGKDGKIYVVRMNVTSLAKVMQGEVAKALAEVGAEEDALYRDIVQ